mmetsp:Transcript_1418/g.4234  ORF Transcript_1418/g.4234 Transcript_1418/m.4234 type:complete len:273 (-) Transcript_1418:380-1198(-)
MSPFKTVLGLAGGREALLLRWLPRPANKADLGIRIAVGMIITAARTAGILGSTLSDAVEQALVDVILAGAPAVQALPNEPQHVIHDLSLSQVGGEAAAEGGHGAGSGLEAGEAAVLHHLHQQQQPVRMLACRQKPPDAQHLEVVEQLGGAAVGVGVHDLQQLPGELEWSRLEVDAPRGVAQHKPEVDVHQVARLVHQDVAVVPVLDLQQVGDQAVGGHALHERPLRHCPLWSARGSKAGKVVVAEGAAGGALGLDGVDAGGVGDKLDEGRAV